jgi:hypothetical protein
MAEGPRRNRPRLRGEVGQAVVERGAGVQRAVARGQGRLAMGGGVIQTPLSIFRMENHE